MQIAEGPIPPDDGPVEDAVLVDMDGDDVAFIFFLYFMPTKGQTGLTFANATSRDIHISRSRDFTKF